MNRINNKTLLIIIGVLLLSNLALLAVYFKPAQPPKQRNPSDFMIRELQLDEAQAAWFRVALDSLHQRNKPLYDGMRSEKEKLFGYLKADSVPDSLVKAAIQRVNTFDDSILLNNYGHFARLRKQINPDQQIKLDTVLLKIARRRK
ncbi:hypothetical protein [Flavihumibacter petaseus]|uniref:Periplasmic heavy metal sensor n=1 Tax=Flavihumibacter petaseus NBRC 106054 TaxID=1220578 RepID=A0A0E9N548_9BACT|nr:hypothetical protein [Flavihumibacter petaseus]GAO44939.1 hypothetical protein FPE01S_04_01820 [Flavihumibacter petaseus NBRC 106054]